MEGTEKERNVKRGKRSMCEQKKGKKYTRLQVSETKSPTEGAVSRGRGPFEMGPVGKFREA